MSVSGKNMKISCGIAYGVEEKGKTIEIPSKTAGERRVPQIQNVSEIFDYITASDHTSELDEKGKVIRRRAGNGKILTGREEEMDR